MPDLWTRPKRGHRCLRSQATPDPLKEVVLTHPESLGSRPAAVPPLQGEDENRGPHRRSSCHRTHPTPSRIVGGLRAGRRHPRAAPTRQLVIEPGLDEPFPDYGIESVPQARDGKLEARISMGFENTGRL